MTTSEGSEKMERYEHYSTPDGYGPADPIEDSDGRWVRYEDAFAAIAAEREDAASLRTDAERYRKVRRGQHWSVVDGIGDALRGDALDAEVDAVPAVGAA